MMPNHAGDLYRQTAAQARIHPVKLIHLMYKRVLQHLDEAAEGIAAHNSRQRGEHLGKAIALISELNASIAPADDSDAAEFLRGLYTSILLELPKVAVNNNIDTLRRAQDYIQRLSKIWEETAMREHNLVMTESKFTATNAAHKGHAADDERDMHDAPSVAVQGVSVSI